MIKFIMATVLMALLVLDHHHQVASATMAVSYGQIMQLVRAHRPQRFSYCMHAVSRTFLRFDGEVPSTRGMRQVQLLCNANHVADYGPYYFVELVGVSVADRMLAGINANTISRDAATGMGGAVLDVGKVGTVMVRAAYNNLERAAEEHLQPIGLPRVSITGYSFCLQGETTALWRRIPTVTLHFRGARRGAVDLAAQALPDVSQLRLHDRGSRRYYFHRRDASARHTLHLRSQLWQSLLQGGELRARHWQKQNLSHRKNQVILYYIIYIYIYLNGQ
jgi:hypothetical protein